MVWLSSVSVVLDNGLVSGFVVLVMFCSMVVLLMCSCWWVCVIEICLIELMM